MKELRFKTSKGEFILVDEKDYPIFQSMININGYYHCKLKEVTEEQASEIVHGWMSSTFNKVIYEKYTDSCFNECNFYNNAIDSLHSLLKSKGIHLYKTPFANKIGITDFDYHINKAEGKTFYNPYIFKIKK